MKFSFKCFYVTMQKKMDRLFWFVGIDQLKSTLKQSFRSALQRDEQKRRRKKPI